MPNVLIVKRRDYDGDVKQRSIPLTDSTTKASAEDLNSALKLWLGGGVAGDSYQEEITPDSGLFGASPAYQGGLTMVIQVEDLDTQTPAKIRVPIPDVLKAQDTNGVFAFVKRNGLTVANPAHLDYAALETEIEQHISIDGGGGTVVLQQIYIEE